jgi:hypothetical protein
MGLTTSRSRPPMPQLTLMLSQAKAEMGIGFHSAPIYRVAALRPINNLAGGGRQTHGNAPTQASLSVVVWRPIFAALFPRGIMPDTQSGSGTTALVCGMAHRPSLTGEASCVSFRCSLSRWRLRPCS